MRPADSLLCPGAGAAAIVSACFGCCVLAVLAAAGDASKSIAHALTFYKPTGPLSGVSALAIAAWLAAWALCHQRWKSRSISFRSVRGAAFLLLAVAFLLTFPPFEDLLIGK